MSKLTIINGHFWKDNKKVNLEFGNAEQINALRECNKMIEKFKEGVSPDVSFEIEATANFKCVCGSGVNLSVDVESTDELDNFEEKQARCYICKKEYKFTLEEDYRVHNGRRMYYGSELLVKLIK